MRAKAALALIPAMVLLAGCDLEDIGGFQRQHEDFHYNYPMKAGGRLNVEGFNGSIEITPWDQDTIDISGTKYARSLQDLADVRITIDHDGSSTSIRASRPMGRYGNYGARFAIKVPHSVVLDRLTTSNGAIRTTDGVGPGRFKTSNGGVHVFGFKGELNLETSNGTIELHNVDGSVTGRTSNGSVRGEGNRGSVDISTSNGGVNLRLDRAESVKVGSSNGSIDLGLPAGSSPAVYARTSNSSITLRVPSEPNARLSASTSNGSITTDFEMRMRGQIDRHHLEGTLGSGGPLIELTTSNGGIRIVRQ